MNILIISLNFNPGHFSHLTANYKLFEDYGFTPYLYVNRSFNQMDLKNKFNRINNLSELKKLKTIDAAVFWFPSLRNIFEIIRLRIFRKSKIIYIYHEPFESIKSYYNSGFRFKKIVKICLINLVTIPVVLLSHRIILPSSSSFFLYKKKYTFLNKNYSLIPLLFDDEAGLLLEKADKNFISYIGTIAADHGFDRFVDFAESAIKNGWFPKLNFLIATRNKIPVREKDILEPYLRSGKLVISEGRPMTNEEINQYYRDSLVVWNAYNRSMQSGVLPKAYMFGAAVIVLLCNANEFFDNHKTGVSVKDNKDVNELKKAVEEILGQKELFFQNCRNKFFEKFYYKDKTGDFISLLQN
ncbi:MAG: hypothetical protein AB1498_12795 [bacterium]